MTAPPPEVLQATILNTLATNSSGDIPDTRELTYNGFKIGGGEVQERVKGVLDSLWSKEVRSSVPRSRTQVGLP